MGVGPAQKLEARFRDRARPSPLQIQVALRWLQALGLRIELGGMDGDSLAVGLLHPLQDMAFRNLSVAGFNLVPL